MILAVEPQKLFVKGHNIFTFQTLECKYIIVLLSEAAAVLPC